MYIYISIYILAYSFGYNMYIDSLKNLIFLFLVLPAALAQDNAVPSPPVFTDQFNLGNI